MNIVAVCGFCIAAVMICKAVEKESSQTKTILVLAVISVILISSLSLFGGIFSAVSQIFDEAGIDDMYLKIIFKGLGICYLTQFAADYCKDCGETAIGSQVVLAGKISMLLISLPLLRTFIEIIKTLII